MLALVYAYPLVRLVSLSTKNVLTYRFTQPVGLANYRALPHDAYFTSAIKDNLKLLLAVPALLALSILVAAALRERRRGWRVQRSFIFLLYVLPIPALGLALNQMLQKNGMLNSALSTIGLGTFAHDWVGSPGLAIWTVLAVIIVKELGLGMMLFSARLASADEELYEAARLDGARPWRRFVHITVPEVRDLAGSYVLLVAVTMMSWVFAYVYTLTGGGPSNSSTVLELYLYRSMFGQGSGQQNIGGAAAAGVVLLLAMVVVLVVTGLLRLAVRSRRRTVR